MFSLPAIFVLFYRLSERNVIEIVAKLVEQKLIEVIHTLDGKEYLTYQELAKEIQDELFVHGGKVLKSRNDFFFYFPINMIKLCTI